MKVYLAKKNGRVIFNTDLTAMKEIDGISKPDRTVTVEEWEAVDSVAHINAAGEIVLGEPEDVVARRKELADLTNEEATLQRELDLTDWRVIRAAERGQVLSDTDAKLHKRREWCRDRISAIRERLGRLNGEDAAA